jgi:hypothetical protein
VEVFDHQAVICGLEERVLGRDKGVVEMNVPAERVGLCRTTSVQTPLPPCPGAGAAPGAGAPAPADQGCLSMTGADIRNSRVADRITL